MSETDVPSAQLRITYGPRKGDIIPLPQTGLVIGRAHSADLTINHGNLSRKHTRIAYEDGRWTLIDLDSTNHTFLNDEQLKPNAPYPLKHGDRIQLSNVVMVEFEESLFIAKSTHTARAS